MPQQEARQLALFYMHAPAPRRSKGITLCGEPGVLAGQAAVTCPDCKRLLADRRPPPAPARAYKYVKGEPPW